jgi:transcriptional regulator with XRE-family HTH domain
MRRESVDKGALSGSIRGLREEMGLTQPEFANRVGVAIRTIARWEKDQPPHGQALIKLAQLADSRGRKDMAESFVAALRSDKTSHYAASEPELKAWSEGLTIAFRLRLTMAARKRWLQIAELIVEAVALAADSQEGVGDQKFREFVDLRQQLEDALDQYRE